jgi:hypothetical protein
MWLLAEIQKPNVLFLIGLAMACAILLMRSQRRIRQTARTSNSVAAPAPNPPLKRATEFERWEVQMHETAREITARIDSKLGLLEQLIRDADDRIARLQTVSERLDRSGTVEKEPAIALAKLSHTQSHQPAPRPGSTMPVAPVATPPAKTTAASRRYEEIYALADAGHNSAAIASQLNSPVGEVELILGLRAQR